MQCNHLGSLQRVKRNIWHKFFGIREVYMCQKCGKKVTFR
ncbi:Uncharacterised protein [Vibrio furnissii]|nr:Uncharacterised protein [Vibrio furnissii]